MMNDRSIAETPRNRRMAIHRLHAPAVCSLLICALLAASSGSPGSAWAQMPDNRGVKLNPEDSVPPAYLDTLDERDRVRLDAARRQGDSFVPIFPGRGQAPGYTQPAGGVGSTRSVTETPPSLQHQPGGRVTPRPTYEAYSPPRQEGRPPGRPEDRISDLIGVLLQNWSKPPQIVRIRYPPAKPETAAPATSGTPPEPSIPLPPAGGGIYARTIYAVNSDYPGPVLIELLGPPLAGAVATGAFTLVGERMVLRLTDLEYRGRRMATDGWAVGLDCACYGIAGEVDSHFFQRVLLPAAVRFAEGFLTAMGRPAESLTLGSGDVRYERRQGSTREAVHSGLGTAARSAGDILLENAPKRVPTVRIPRDTELIVMFARPPGTTPENRARPEAPAVAERNDLGQAMISLVRDLEPGLLLLVSALCYVLALFAFAQGLLRLLKTSEDKFHAPSGGGTALSFLICIVMASLPSWLSAAGESLFGSGARPAAASLGYGARGADYDALLAAVFTLVSLVGLFAFIRGAFTLRAAADGKPGASGPKAFAHMAGGIAAWHIVAVIEAVQTSLGIAVLNIR